LTIKREGTTRGSRDFTCRSPLTTIQRCSQETNHWTYLFPSKLAAVCGRPELLFCGWGGTEVELELEEEELGDESTPPATEAVGRFRFGGSGEV
jgi:hypothetical protein